MKWTFVDPAQINPELFDLSRLYACKVKKYRGTEDMRDIRMNGWHLYADLVEVCPVTGNKLQESTWYLFAALGPA